VTTATDLLAPAHVASLVAPTIDRLRLAVSRSMRASAAERANALGLDDRVGSMMAMLHNIGPDQVVARAAVLAIYVYQPQAVAEHGIARAVAAGLLAEPADGLLHLTDRGRALVADLYAIGDAAALELWSADDERIGALAAIAAKAAQAAMADGGDALAAMAPKYEPAGASDAALLAERLTALRFHRFDAHVAAWRAAGLTAEQIKALPGGPQRDAIEAETNCRAATPYAALDAVERLDLLAGLGALSG
jgi:hypothetical protein